MSSTEVSTADRQTHHYCRRTSGCVFFFSLVFMWTIGFFVTVIFQFNDLRLVGKWDSSLSLFFIHWTLQFVLHFIKLFKVNMYIHTHTHAYAYWQTTRWPERLQSCCVLFTWPSIQLSFSLESLVPAWIHMKIITNETYRAQWFFGLKVIVILLHRQLIKKKPGKSNRQLNVIIWCSDQLHASHLE